MKKILLGLAVVALALVTAPSAQASGYAQGQLLFVGDNTVPQGVVSITNPINNSAQFGWFAWGQATDEWVQAYAGPTLNISFVQVGLGVGLESEPDPIRLGAYAYLEKGDVWSIFSFEDGGSGTWHQFIASYQANDWLGFGLMDERYLGTGPRVQYSYKMVQLWTAALWEDGDANGTAALRYKF